jgi:hypothetical protein
VLKINVLQQQAAMVRSVRVQFIPKFLTVVYGQKIVEIQEIYDKYPCFFDQEAPEVTAKNRAGRPPNK